MLEVKNLVKEYNTKGGATVRALNDVSITFPEKGMVFLLGKSGSGKSTLLNVAGGLDKPDSGEIIVKGRSSKDFSASDFDSYRNTCVGFVFQEYNILGEFTIEQNIALALQLQNKKNDKAAVNDLLDKVDLHDFGKRKPNTLSGGQKQRVAIARALIKDPEIIMADEPTGALDSGTGKQIFDTLKKLSESRLVIIVSHDREFAERYADRIIELSDGKVISDVTKTFAEPTMISDNVSVVSGDTIRIKNAENITENDVKNIVEILKKKGGEAIIASGENKLGDVKRACKMSADGSEETFKTTEKTDAKPYDGKNTKFIRSKLPAAHAFKIGASGLKTKPVRLIFTVILSVIAFSLFGVLSAFMTYDKDYSIAKALQASNNPAAKVQTVYSYSILYYSVDSKTGEDTVSYTYSQTSQANISESDVQKLNDNNLGVKYAGVFNPFAYGYNKNGISTGVSAIESTDYYRYTDLCGFTDCGEEFLNSCGFALTKGKYPTDSNEIAVSEYIDELFKAAGETTALNKRITIENYASGGKTVLTISGIYRTGTINEKFDVLKKDSDSLTLKERQEKEKLAESFSDYLKNSFNLVAFVSKDFYDAHKSPVTDDTDDDYSAYLFGASAIDGVAVADSPIKTSDEYGYSSYLYTETTVARNAKFFTFVDKNGNETKGVTADNLNLGENEVYVPFDILEKIYDGTSGSLSVKRWYFKDVNGKSGEFTVKGYYKLPNTSYYGNAALIVSNEFVKNHSSADSYTYLARSSNYVAPANAKYSFALAKTDNSYAQTSYILKGDKSTGVSRSIDSSIFQGIQLMILLIEALSVVFLVVGIIIGGLASLMLLNFISASIAAKTKEIGILRAVGARGIDVFKIFFSEALIFALASFVLSSIGAGLLCNMINKIILESTIIPTAALLNYNILNVGITLLISLFISALATFFPVFNAARKSPVESIRTL